MEATAFLLVAAALGFAYSLGAHYTGACMGMSRAAGAIRSAPALLLMAPLVLLGAVFASGAVERTVGHGILGGAPVPLGVALAIVLSAFALTTAFNLLRLPTSTIQILVFAAVGAGVASGRAVSWPTIERLAVVWAVAPFATFALGFLLTRLSDRRGAPPSQTGPLGSAALLGLLGMGAAASFAMGANDVSNASGAFVMTGLFGVELAGLVGGVGLALGVLTWGRPLLERVAFDIVRLDARTATISQLAQSAVVLVSVAFGYFTSLNQALVGGMLGVGVARRRSEPSAIVGRTVRGLLLGWAVGPVAGLAGGLATAAVLPRLGLP